jgi:hypothetical protein
VAATDIPDDNDALKAALIETRGKLSGAEAAIELSMGRGIPPLLGFQNSPLWRGP